MALPSRSGAVIEDVAQMAIAASAQNLDAHAVAIDMRRHIFIADRLKKAGPAGAGVELGVGRKERQLAANAGIDAGLLVVEQGAAERAFGTFAARDGELHRRQLRSPFSVSFAYAIDFDGADELALAIDELDFHDGLLGARIGDSVRWLRKISDKGTSAKAARTPAAITLLAPKAPPQSSSRNQATMLLAPYAILSISHTATILPLASRPEQSRAKPMRPFPAMRQLSKVPASRCGSRTENTD
jgi:hypothetical protein